VATFTDGSTAEVTALCTFSPAAAGAGVVATVSNAVAGEVTLVGKGTQTVRVTCSPSYIGQAPITATATLVVP